MQTKPRTNEPLTPAQFDQLVEDWNALPEYKKRAHTRRCKKEHSHYWVPTPLNLEGEMTVQEVCLFCLDYRCSAK